MHRRGFYVKKWVKSLLAFLNVGSSSQQEKGDSFAAVNQCQSNRHAIPRRKPAVALAKNIMGKSKSLENPLKQTFLSTE